jgi:branched-chain amino acid transport system permease protein
MTDILVDGLRAAVGPVAIYYALAALGLNLHFGYTGLLNFGQVGFMLVGGYGVAVSVAIWQWPLWVGVIFALALVTVLALLLGVPTLRLRADYLAITTIAAAEILRFVTRSSPATDVTAGPFGIPSQISDARGFADGFYAPTFFGVNLNPFTQTADYVLGPLTFTGKRLWVIVFGWGLVLLVTGLLWFLMRSPWGRVIRAIREDEDAARALGKNVFSYKMQSLVLGGLMGGLAGVILAFSQEAIFPDIFMPQVTFYAYTILILGGTATTWGPLLGAVLFQFLITAGDSVLRGIEVIPNNSIGGIRFALVGLVLMLLTIYRPQGLTGNREEMMLDA